MLSFLFFESTENRDTKNFSSHYLCSMFRILLLLTSSALLFSSCATTNIRVKVTYPPQISLPQNIKNVALINRTRIDSAHKKENALESILTGEAIAGDMIGSEECLNS